MNSEQPMWKKHKFLHHYTSAVGFKKILESQTLWATHYKYLNDTAEIEHLRKPLEQALLPVSKERFLKLHRESFSNRREFKKRGGIITESAKATFRFIDIFYKTTFEGGNNYVPLFEPFITSFCGHGDDERYEQENGLLSQWRAYADGGYALVFDTQKLWNLAKNEVQKYHQKAGITLGNVVYEGDQEAFQKEFSEFIEILKGVFFVYLDDIEKFTAEKALGPFISSTARYKHQGFKEEQEVRFIVTPVDKEYQDKFLKIDPDFKIEEKELKKIKHRKDGNREVPYIELFDCKNKLPLPIKKIIVGPHSEQAKHKKNALQLISSLNLDIEVACSKTPYIGNK